jgi:hypothetical protein
MENAGSYVAYEELIRKGWFRRQLTELARDLEVLEQYGRITAEQREQLLQLAREADHFGAGPAPQQ